MAKAEHDPRPRERDVGSTTRPGPHESATEKRLASLRASRPKVAFADQAHAIPMGSRGDAEQAGHRVGALRRANKPAAGVGDTLALREKMKVEMVDLTKPGRSPSPHPRRAKQKSSSLVRAAEVHQEAQSMKERSRSRGRRRRSRKRRKSSSSSRSGRSRTSSSDSSLLPPLRRKSQKQPGSVFKMLEQQAYDFLAQDGVLEDRELAEQTSQRPKLFTYYQLGIKPGLDPRSRDAKELGLLCRALDMLKEGKLDTLSDLLSARLMAVETSTKQGWNTARHLELYDGEEEGSAPAHILLAAQKHGKQVERAGGKGSWPKSPSWPSNWFGENQTKGKGKDQKGKGKRGKGKGKGGKNWQTWGSGEKDKKDPKGPGEGAT